MEVAFMHDHESIMVRNIKIETYHWLDTIYIIL